MVPLWYHSGIKLFTSQELWVIIDLEVYLAFKNAGALWPFGSLTIRCFQIEGEDGPTAFF